MNIKNLLSAWRLAALFEWEKGIRDKTGSLEIENYFKEVGWGRWVRGGYSNKKQFAWCGIFVGYTGLNLGDHVNDTHSEPVALDYDIARMVMPSTYRIGAAEKWKSAGVPVPGFLPTKDLDLLAHNLLPGMVVTVKTKRGNLKYGGHIVIVDRVNEDGTFDTIEGNGWGELADGEYGEGVIRRRGNRARELSEIVLAPQLTKWHFDTFELQEDHYTSLKA